MTTTTLDYLFRAQPPWLRVGMGESARTSWIPSYFYSRPEINMCVRQLRGHKMRSVDALMNEFAAAFQFFPGFGENWYALSDCLQCMNEWLPADGYVLIVERAEDILSEEPMNQLSELLITLHEVGEQWARPIEYNGRFTRVAIPFHVLLYVSSGIG